MWHLALGRSDQDFGREEGAMMLEQFLRSRHRTADPAAADFFVVPIAGGPGVRRMRALRHVARRWPFFNASVAADTATHIFPTVCDDGGWARVADVWPEMRRMGPVPEGAPLEAGMPPLLRHSIFLSCHGRALPPATATTTFGSRHGGRRQPELLHMAWLGASWRCSAE